MATQSDTMADTKSAAPKPPIVRGARACTVCRAAKMKCVGAEDGQKPCQRCKRANLECVFEKHRRGRKPGSKLSEASKMLRRLEKGLNTAKMKSQATDAAPFHGSDPHAPNQQDALYASESYPSSTTHFPSNELPPLNFSNFSPAQNYQHHGSVPRSMDIDDDDEDPDRNEDPIFPAKLIKRENRNSFFRTILNPEDPPASASTPNGATSFSPPQQPRVAPTPNGLNDPITAGIINEDDAKVLFDLIYLRLNPFINLFDPSLHSVNYVRSKCPFLFTTLIMAGCRFFKPEAFKQCQKLANEFAVRAFAEAWKRVEVVQAFACLTYWRNPNDNRTWTYIGYACRMAVELGLNRYVANPPPNETEFQQLERRNRERTYLVLFVHDRSLSTQTGRHWMLPEDDIIRHSSGWHKRGGGVVRPEDVIIAAFVALRRIAAETTDIFYTSKDTGPGTHSDVNYELVLRNCNTKLTNWADEWKHEMDRAGGSKFHSSFLSLFRLHVRLFLNSFALHAAITPSSRQSPSVQALSTCCQSALESLRIVSEDFRNMSMLRYGQDSILVMSAYSAIILLKLLRSPSTSNQLNGNTSQDIHQLIIKTAEAYQDAAQLSPAESTSSAYHARFLRNLVSNDTYRAARRMEDERHENGIPLDPRLSASGAAMTATPPVQQQQQQQQQQNQYPHTTIHQVHDQPTYHFQNGASSNVPPPTHIQPAPSQSMPVPAAMRGNEGASEYVADQNRGVAYPGVNHSNPNSAGIGTDGVVQQGLAAYHGAMVPHAPQHASELDAHYWKNMFLELGFGENEGAHIMQAQTTTPSAPQPIPDSRGLYVDHQHHQHQSYQQTPQAPPTQSQPQQQPQPQHQPHQHQHQHQQHQHQQHQQQHQSHQPHLPHTAQGHMTYQHPSMHQSAQANGYGR